MLIYVLLAVPATFHRLIFAKFIVQFFPQRLARVLTEKIQILFYAGCSEGAGDFECWTWKMLHLAEMLCLILL
jgi:hypothetical protein